MKKANRGHDKYRLQSFKLVTHADLTSDMFAADDQVEISDSAVENHSAMVEAEVDLSNELIEIETKKINKEEYARNSLRGDIRYNREDLKRLSSKDYHKPTGTRDEIILEYTPLIKFIAQKIAARLPANIELDDLISSGVIGLMDAYEKYDPTRDNKFKTYAEFRVRGAILDELRSQDWVPRSVREKAKTLERAYVKIEHEKGRPATEDEVCAELNLSQEQFHELLNQVRSVSLLSYDDITTLSKNDKRSLLGLGSSSKTATPFSEVSAAHLKRIVAEAIKELPEKQRLVLSLYYYEDLNLKEIGRVLEVTESRVSQLHTQAVLKLKAKLKNNIDDLSSIFN